MSRRRLERLNEQLKREISEILRTRIRDPRVGFPTVTGVQVTPDLWLARVHVRIQGEEGEVRDTLEGLEAAAPFIRRELARVLHVRRVPELRFLRDETLDRAMRIERILDEVLPDAGDEASGGEEDGDDGEGTSA